MRGRLRHRGHCRQSRRERPRDRQGTGGGRRRVARHHAQSPIPTRSPLRRGRADGGAQDSDAPVMAVFVIAVVVLVATATAWAGQCETDLAASAEYAGLVKSSQDEVQKQGAAVRARIVALEGEKKAADG